MALKRFDQVALGSPNARFPVIAPGSQQGTVSAPVQAGYVVVAVTVAEEDVFEGPAVLGYTARIDFKQGTGVK